MIVHFSTFLSTNADDLARCMESLQKDGYVTTPIQSETPLHLVLICGGASGTILEQKRHVEERVRFFGGQYAGWTFPVSVLSVLDLSKAYAEA